MPRRIYRVCILASFVYSVLVRLQPHTGFFNRFNFWVCAINQMNKFLWVFDSDAVWVLAPICGAAWALGGSGYKLFRRLGVGFVIALAALADGGAWWVCAAQFLALFIVTSLAYGDDIRVKIVGMYYPILFLIGAGYGLSLLPIAFLSSNWSGYLIACLVMPIGFAGTTIISQHTQLPWKLSEIITGFVLGLCAANILF